MPLHIDELLTDIQVDSTDPSPRAGAPQPAWQQLAQLRGLLDRLLDDGARTAASGNDD